MRKIVIVFAFFTASLAVNAQESFQKLELRGIYGENDAYNSSINPDSSGSSSFIGIGASLRAKSGFGIKGSYLSNKIRPLMDTTIASAENFSIGILKAGKIESLNLRSTLNYELSIGYASGTRKDQGYRIFQEVGNDSVLLERVTKTKSWFAGLSLKCLRDISSANNWLSGVEAEGLMMKRFRTEVGQTLNGEGQDVTFTSEDSAGYTYQLKADVRVYRLLLGKNENFSLSPIVGFYATTGSDFGFTSTTGYRVGIVIDSHKECGKVLEFSYQKGNNGDCTIEGFQVTLDLLQFVNFVKDVKPLRGIRF